MLGASGFLGSALLGALCGRAVEVRAVSRRAVAVPTAAAEGHEHRHVRADLCEPGAVAEAVDGADVVVNLVAALDGGRSWRVGVDDDVAERTNVGVNAAIVAAAGRRGGPRPVVVFTSSSSLGRARDGRVDGSEVDEPVGAYAHQKLLAERTLHAATAAGAVTGVVVRLPTVFGDGRGPSGTGRGVVATMVDHALAGRSLTMWNDGTPVRDLLYLGDAVTALVAAIDHAHALAGLHWVVGTGVGTPLRQLFELVAQAVAEHTGRPPVPVIAVPPPEWSVPTDHEGHVVDAAAFRRRTGWAPTVPLAEAIRRTVGAAAPAAGR